MELTAGDIIELGKGNTFLLLDHISAGSYGEVWTATWIEADARVAMKFVHIKKMVCDPRHDQAQWPASLQREIAFLETIRARHIVRLLRTGEFAGHPVLVMERLDRTLAAAESVDLPTALDWLRQLALGLVSLHGNGLRHLDLKPANILLTADSLLGPVLRLADFGTLHADSEPAHHFCGSVGWQAPEQFWPAERTAQGFVYRTDHRADIYVLGLLLFYLVTGGERTTFAERARQLHAQNPELSAWFESRRDIAYADAADSERFLQATAGESGRQREAALRLLQSLLAATPEQRPQAQEVVHLIQAIL